MVFFVDCRLKIILSNLKVEPLQNRSMYNIRDFAIAQCRHNVLFNSLDKQLQVLQEAEIRLNHLKCDDMTDKNGYNLGKIFHNNGNG